MRRRAEHVEETRLRITEAAVKLHTSIGPANTTIAGIADAAGVTRLTVYRHFADADEVFLACMGHWSALHPAPDPAPWRAEPDLETRVRLALGQMSDWYQEVAGDLAPIERDVDLLPASARDRRDRQAMSRVDAILADAPDPSGTLRAVIGHVVAVGTWRSLVVDQGLSPAIAVELEVGWVLDAAPARPARASGRDPTSGGPGRSPGRGGRGRSTAASRGPRAGGGAALRVVMPMRWALDWGITVSAAATIATVAPVTSAVSARRQAWATSRQST